MPPRPPTPDHRPRTWRRKLLLAILLSAIVTACYLERTPLLTSLAYAWIIDEPPQKSDAILVPGGGIGPRPLEAVRLYQEGYAPKILILDVKPDLTQQLGLAQLDRDLMRQVLIKKGVPDSNIVTIGNAVSSTYADVSAAADWARTSGAKRLLIVTDLFHTRRLKWVANRVLQKIGVQSTVRALTPPEYAVTNRWREEEGLIAFQNEVVKFGMYHWKY